MSNEQREQAREMSAQELADLEAIMACGDLNEQYIAASIDNVRRLCQTVSSYDTEVREALRGLASKVYVSFQNEYCRCARPSLATRPEGDRHDTACTAARALYAKRQTTASRKHIMIKYPVRLERDPETIEVHIRDASNRVIASRLIGIDAQEIVDALNTKGAPRARKRRRETADDLRASDLTAQTVGRDDIEYGHHESLPRGEHVARLSKEHK